VRHTFLILLLLFAEALLSSAQRIGRCPANAPRDAERLRELRGVVVDRNLAVIPKVKIRLQVPEGEDFREVEATETDPTGRFSFKAKPSENYRLVFTGPLGFCTSCDSSQICESRVQRNATGTVSGRH
jgi:hypothetical protein